MEDIHRLVENASRMFLQNSAAQTPSKLPGRLADATTEDLFTLLSAAYRMEVGRRGNDCLWDAFTEERLQKVARWLKESRRTGLLLYGSVGTGKTTALKVLEQLFRLDAGQSSKVRNISCVALVTTFSSDSYLYAEARECRTLLLDELGCEPECSIYGVYRTPVIDLLCSRYNYQRPTVVTTNLGDREILERYGARLWDRFQEEYDRITYEGSSYRTR